jgi:hypothetical protein
MTERERLAGIYRDIFEVDARGQAIYDDLYKRFGASAKVHTDGGIDAVLKTYKDAAQRSVIEYIVRMVNIGNGAEDVNDADK